MRRILLYVHFNKYHVINPHVFYQLEQIRPLYDHVVFISNSKVTDEFVTKLEQSKLVDDIILRENKGFDFAAWRDGLLHVGFEKVSSYDSVTLMNDTCFGPLWNLEPIYQGFEQDEEVDFWGITNNRANELYPEHIQSYFVVYKQKVTSSREFKEYWANIKDYEDVQEVIDHYETQTTSFLNNLGFKSRVIFDTVDREVHSAFPPDFSLYHPTLPLKEGVPFLKVKSLEANNAIAPYLLDYISQYSDYPLDVMLHHLSDVYLPDEPYKLGKKYLAEKVLQGTNQKIAVHLHVFYTDLLEDFLDAFATFNFSYDLFVTTDSTEKKTEILKVLDERQVRAQLFVNDNVGRDIIPLLKLKDELSRYDIIGHFHTKKSKEADFWAGESWRNELIDSMVYRADSILENLKSDTLGLVIADIPTFFRYNKIVDPGNEALISPIMNDLWNRMKLRKSIDFETFQTFVMSYGTFVWFKYDALQPLFELEIDKKEIPVEPLPQNSILHAIERLLIYIAWNQHYDFRIAPSPESLTPFVDSQVLNRHFGKGMKDLQRHQQHLDSEIQVLIHQKDNLTHQIEKQEQEIAFLQTKKHELDLIEASRTWKLRTFVVETFKKITGK